MPFLELEGSPELEGNPREVQQELTVGSGSQAAWRLSGRDLSARHFTLKLDGDGNAIVMPASPQNVVILNGKQLAPRGAPVASGDVIAAGSARFVFLKDRNSSRPKAVEPGQAFLIDVARRKGYALRKRVVQIGREIGCSIVLKDPTVSRFHADIRAEGGEYVLYSMGSAGTKVNGNNLSGPQMLEEGSNIQIGETKFTFSRQALPQGVTSAQFEDHDNDAFSRKKTEVQGFRAVHEGDTGGGKEFKTRQVSPVIIGALVVAVVLAIVLFALR
ncbi:MAG: FHA domain-containing protein [Gemmatimonadaceae bacterium]